MSFLDELKRGLKIIEDKQLESKKFLAKETTVHKLLAKEFGETEAQKIIQFLLRDGLIFEPKAGYFRKTV